jgi:hypothetical protein
MNKGRRERKEEKGGKRRKTRTRTRIWDEGEKRK